MPDAVQTPRGTWSDKAAYEAKARELVGRFQKNFVQFEGHIGEDVRRAAPAAPEAAVPA